MSLVELDTIVGDESGTVTLRFSVETLREFIAMLNMNAVHNSQGHRLTFVVREWVPGDAVLECTLHTDAGELS